MLAMESSMCKECDLPLSWSPFAMRSDVWPTSVCIAGIFYVWTLTAMSWRWDCTYRVITLNVLFPIPAKLKIGIQIHSNSINRFSSGCCSLGDVQSIGKIKMTLLGCDLYKWRTLPIFLLFCIIQPFLLDVITPVLFNNHPMGFCGGYTLPSISLPLVKKLEVHFYSLPIDRNQHSRELELYTYYDILCFFFAVHCAFHNSGSWTAVQP